MTDRPHLTVAAVIEHDGRFLLVEEQPEETLVLNQPAGHVENGETVIEAAIRETLEETGRQFTPEALIGIYTWQNPKTGKHFIRVAIAGSCSEQDPERPLDPEIQNTVWLDRNEIYGRRQRLRSPMVLRCVEDYLAGRRLPLDTITHLI